MRVVLSGINLVDDEGAPDDVAFDRGERRAPAGRLRRLGSHLGTGVLAAAVVLAAAIQIATLTGVCRLVPILSGSMAPAMPTGSLAIVRRVPASSMAVGQILVFSAPTPDHPTVAHRVVSLKPEQGRVIVQTKGDMNAGPDPWSFAIAGTSAWRVSGVIRFAGWLILATGQPLVRFGLVLLVAGVGSALALRYIWRPQQDLSSSLSHEELCPTERWG